MSQPNLVMIMPVATGFKLQGQAGPPVASADARDVTGADAQTALAVVQKGRNTIWTLEPAYRKP